MLPVGQDGTRLRWPGAIRGEDAECRQQFPEPPLPAAGTTPAQALPQGSLTRFPGSQGHCAWTGQHHLRPTELREEALRAAPWGLALTWPEHNARGSAKPGERPWLRLSQQNLPLNGLFQKINWPESAPLTLATCHPKTQVTSLLPLCRAVESGCPMELGCSMGMRPSPPSHCGAHSTRQQKGSPALPTAAPRFLHFLDVKTHKNIPIPILSLPSSSQPLPIALGPTLCSMLDLGCPKGTRQWSMAKAVAVIRSR